MPKIKMMSENAVKIAATIDAGRGGVVRVNAPIADIASAMLHESILVSGVRVVPTATDKPMRKIHRIADGDNAAYVRLLGSLCCDEGLYSKPYKCDGHAIATDGRRMVLAVMPDWAATDGFNLDDDTTGIRDSRFWRVIPKGIEESRHAVTQDSDFWRELTTAAAVMRNVERTAQPPRIGFILDGKMYNPIFMQETMAVMFRLGVSEIMVHTYGSGPMMMEGTDANGNPVIGLLMPFVYESGVNFTHGSAMDAANVA